MSEEKDNFVPGPIDVTKIAAKPAAKKRAAPKKKRAAAKVSKSASKEEKPAVKEGKPAARGRKKVESPKDEESKASGPVDTESKKSTKSEDPKQKTLLFSSDAENSSDQKPAEGKDKDAGSNKEPSNKESSNQGSDKPESSDQSEGGEKTQFVKRGDGRPQRGGNQKGSFKGRQNKQNQQQQLSNRKKKQQQWKQKQKQKKGPKDRFKIDGLNADFDNALELGKLLECDLLANEESLNAYLAEQPETKAEPVFNFNETYDLQLDELREAAKATGKELPSAPNRKQLIEFLLKHAHEEQRPLELSGLLEILSDGQGLLTYSSDSYRLRTMSAFVPAFFIKKYGLQRGQELKCSIIPPIEEASCPLVTKILAAQGMEPEKVNEIVPFTEQIPYYPLDRIFLESEEQEDSNKVSMRVVDLISPIGFGQRGLIVAPPRTGKTVLLQGMANSIQSNYPDAQLIILLIDERPEEVTDFKRRVKGGEVISSTFDENAESHVHAAEMVIEKSRRMVEAGRDVVILLDSITRLARAYNTVMPSSGKILSGGVEANALQKPKRFFGSARNIEGGGSLTIIATALVETGSKMDEVIFEEFKGTGNMELHLDRALVDKRVFPSLSMEKSGTRKEELLYHPEELTKIYGLRRAMKGVPSTEAMEMLIMKVKKTGSNAEFLMTAPR